MGEKFGLCNTLAFNLKAGTCVRIIFYDMYGLSSNVNSVRQHTESKVNKYVDGVVSAYIEGNQTVVITTCYGDVTLRIEDFITNKIELVELITAKEIEDREKKPITLTIKQLRNVILKWIDHIQDAYGCDNYDTKSYKNTFYCHMYYKNECKAFIQVMCSRDHLDNICGYEIFDTDKKPNSPFIVISGRTVALNEQCVRKNNTLGIYEILFSFIEEACSELE